MAGREGIQIGMLLFFCAGLLGASCTAKLCANAEDCRRECECFNEDTQRATQCSVAFECNVVDGMCGADYEQSCKEICQVYAARDACGTRTCEQ
ncbi:MAG: hypothetical protein ACO3JL_19135, partial [Myxococcota bacterium]